MEEIFISAIIGVLLMLFIVTVFILSIIRYNKKLFAHFQEKQQLQMHFQQQMLQSQLEIQEHTFNNISQEIHDSVGQTLSLAKVQLNTLEQCATMNLSLLNDTKESVSKAMTDLRDIAKSLNSERVKLLNLTEMTNHELQRIERIGTIQTEIAITGKEINLQEQKRLIVFRIIQESLQNILKHAQAKNIDVRFDYQEANVRIAITDNGIGFDKELLSQKDGLGLQNIKSRAALIGGEAAIDSSVNKGTTITLILPYE